MKLLLIDNYDSFTYNLVHYIQHIDGIEVDVFRNDKISLQDVSNYDSIVLSPGPGLPVDAGISIPLIKKYAASKNILGVCLGHQAIGEAFGARLKNLDYVLHGVARTTVITDRDENLFSGIPDKFFCGRYHSWVIEKESIPNDLKIIAVDDNKNIMAIKHSQYNVYGFQFHPESILTEYGLQLMNNWLLSLQR